MATAGLRNRGLRAVLCGAALAASGPISGWAATLQETDAAPLKAVDDRAVVLGAAMQKAERTAFNAQHHEEAGCLSSLQAVNTSVGSVVDQLYGLALLDSQMRDSNDDRVVIVFMDVVAATAQARVSTFELSIVNMDPACASIGGVAAYAGALREQLDDADGALKSLQAKLGANPFLPPGPGNPPKLQSPAPAVPPTSPPTSPPGPAEPQAGCDPSLIHMYPERAQTLGRSGEAVIRCTIGEDGHYRDCTVVSQQPGGWGFGEAAVKMSCALPVTAGPDGTPPRPGQTVERRVPFTAPKRTCNEEGPTTVVCTYEGRKDDG